MCDEGMREIAEYAKLRKYCPHCGIGMPREEWDVCNMRSWCVCDHRQRGDFIDYHPEDGTPDKTAIPVQKRYCPHCGHGIFFNEWSNLNMSDVCIACRIAMYGDYHEEQGAGHAGIRQDAPEPYVPMVARMDEKSRLARDLMDAVPVAAGPDRPSHYQNYYTRPLGEQEKMTGHLRVKLDPYRICKELDIRGGAREQIVKKGLRWTTKGDSERQVIKEIMQACERHLEMLDEDSNGLTGGGDY